MSKLSYYIGLDNRHIIPVCIAFLIHTTSFSQFVNGDFQTTPTYGCNAGIGWNFSTGSGSEPELTEIFYPGNAWVDLTPCSAWGNGTWIEQIVPTVVNQCYSITIDLGCVYGWDVSDAGVYIQINGVQLGDRLVSNIFSDQPATLGWNTLTSQIFTATSSNTTIRFIGEGRCSEFSVETGQYACFPIGAPGNPGVMGIDNIVLNVLDEQVNNSSSMIVDLCPDQLVTIGEFSQGFSYLWSTGDTTSTITVDEQGTYYLEFLGNCSSGVDTVFVVNQSSPAIVSLGNDTTLCDPFLFSLPQQMNAVLWSNGQINSSISVNEAGVYWAIHENVCGSESDSITISVEQQVSFDLADIEICAGENVFIGQAIDGVQYEWSDNSITPTISVNQTGDYHFHYTSYCSSGDETIHVLVNQQPLTINLGENLSLCDPFILEMPLQPEAVLWSTGEFSTSISVSEIGTYWATNQNDCGIETDSITLNLQSPIDFELEEEYIICDGESLVLTIPDQISIFDWSSEELTRTIILSEGGNYSLNLFDNCNFISIPFEVQTTDCDCHIYIPNVFTANSDHLNDVWNFAISDNCEFILTVWNRWGENIFETNSNQKLWTGNVNDGDYYASDGVYYYTLKYAPKPLVWRQMAGTVTLLR